MGEVPLYLAINMTINPPLLAGYSTSRHPGFSNALEETERGSKSVCVREREGEGGRRRVGDRERGRGGSGREKEIKRERERVCVCV